MRSSIIFISLLLQLNLACSGPGGAFSSGGGLFLKRGSQSFPTNGDQYNESVTSVEDASIYSNMNFEELSFVSFEDYFSEASRLATDDMISFYENDFLSIKSFLEIHEAEYLKISDHFKLIGDYFDAVNISSFNDIRAEMAADGAEFVAGQYESGELEKKIQETYKRDDSFISSDSVKSSNENFSSFPYNELIMIGAIAFIPRGVSFFLGADEYAAAASAAADAAAQKVTENNDNPNMGGQEKDEQRKLAAELKEESQNASGVAEVSNSSTFSRN